MTSEEFAERAKQVHGTKYDYSEVVYRNARTRVRIICPEHGVFEQVPDKHLHGCGCPMCAGNVRNNTEAFVCKARAVHGEKYDYSYVSYVNNKTPVEIVCPVHGSFFQKPTNHLCGKGCPVCGGSMPSTTEQFVLKARSVHGDKYDYSETEYHGNRVKVAVRCPAHGIFWQLPYVHLSGCGCPECGKKLQAMHRDEMLIRAKAENTSLLRYGVRNPMDDPDIRMKQMCSVQSDETNDKRVATKRKNGSFNTSVPALHLGTFLEEVFGSDDVVREYRSDDYPFLCDFYIRSRDLYIELNAHWSHGGHWYTDADAAVVSEWRMKSSYYKNAADTFSVRDVVKRDAARAHGLNYAVFWKADLSDVKEWIRAGCPDAHDWLTEYSWMKN